MFYLCIIVAFSSTCTILTLIAFYSKWLLKLGVVPNLGTNQFYPSYVIYTLFLIQSGETARSMCLQNIEQ